MTFLTVLQQPYALHALGAALCVTVLCGLIGPFVTMRRMAFAVHGTSELAFTGAAAGLLFVHNPILGAFVGALIVAATLALLGNTPQDHDTTIGVVLAFGLGLGVLLLSFYQGFAAQAINILFGNIFGISVIQLAALCVLTLLCSLTMLWIYRPLLFASIDSQVARARGIPVTRLGVIFLFILAISVTAAAQLVGTLLVLSLAITPAAAAQRLTHAPLASSILTIIFAAVAGVGGVMLSLAHGTLKPSVCVACISFGLYIFARLYGPSK